MLSYRLHFSLLLRPVKETGNNKSVFPGVMAYIPMFHFHFTLKSFQKKIFFYGRERGFGILSQFFNHPDTFDFRGIGVGFYCCFVALTTVAGKKAAITVDSRGWFTGFGKGPN